MKIAVAVDGSENALRAAEHAIMLAKHLPEAYIEIIYVADYDKAKNDRLLTQSPESLALKREKRINPILELANAASVTGVVTMLRGNPIQKIIEHVNDTQIDMLIIGSRGLNAFQEMVLGSVSHKVVKHVNCPVTIVK